jgi:hypothetical protein
MKIQLSDFKEIREPEMLAPYYSVTLDNGDQICVEPLLTGEFYVARYDEHQLLIGEKLKTKKNFGFGVMEEVVDLANKLI